MIGGHGADDAPIERGGAASGGLASGNDWDAEVPSRPDGQQANAAQSRGSKRPRRRSRAADALQYCDLLDAVFATPRAVDRSYDAYVRYRDRGCRRRDLDPAFVSALPVIREVCHSRDRALVGAAAWAIFRALRGRRFATGGPQEYWSYLRQTARGAVSHQREADDRFRLVDSVSPEVCFDGMRVTGRVVSIADVERKLVIEKIPLLVAETVVRRLRFEGEERAACLYILRSLLEGCDVVVRGLRVLFEVSCERLRQLVDYVTVAARLALSGIRQELEAAGGDSLGWRGSITMTAWLYGDDDGDGARP